MITGPVYIEVNWAHMFMVLAALIAISVIINYVVYRHESPTKAKNSIDKWFVGMCILLVGYYFISKILYLYIFINLAGGQVVS